MTDKIRSGQEVLEEFFAEIAGIEGMDNDVVKTVMNLHHEGKLTDTNLSNELEIIRKEKNKW